MWHEYPAQQPCTTALSGVIAGHIGQQLQTSDECVLAVSGGRSPIPLFEALSTAQIDWSRVRVQLVDERFVPPDHPDSNEGLVRKHLLQGKAAHAHFIGLYRPGASITQAANAASTELRQPDLAILGMGDDGHTASLFPGARQLESALAPNAARYLHVTPPEAPHERLTLSLASLRACRQLLLYISGHQKRDLLRLAEKQVNRHYPISYLAAEPGASFDVYWHP